MKKCIVFILVFISFLISSCGIKDSITEVTDQATELLEEISDLTRTIDAKIENDQPQAELANILEEKLINLSSVLTQLIEQNGGFLFEQVNGSVDNLFYNTSQLISDIKSEFLGDATVTDIIEQFSDQVEMQVNMLAGHLEDVIVLTAGSVSIVIDKTTNNIIVICSIILLAIGIIIFVILLFRKKSVVRKFGIVLMLVFVLFFLSILFVKPVRVYAIAGLDFGEEIEKITLTPKVRGLLPATFTIGNDERIIIYGTHLDKIENLRVSLTLNQSEKYKFKNKNIIVATPNKIVLGNFDSEQKWIVPTYNLFKQKLQAKTNISISETAIKNYSKEINSVINPVIMSLHTVNIGSLTAQPRHQTLSTINTKEFDEIRKESAVRKFGAANGLIIEKAIMDVFKDQFDIPEGDYGLIVYNGEEKVPSPQFISILYPAPPVPLPDITPVNLYWTNNHTPSKGESTSLTMLLKIDYPNQVESRFKYRITSAPPTSTLETMVTEGEIAAASSNGYTSVTTRSFSIPNPGNYQFTAHIDLDNVIEESNYGNNTFSKQLQVKDFVYDVTVVFSTFQSLQRMDSNDEDEYRLTFAVTVTGYNTWIFNYNKNGINKVYSMNKSKKFNNVNTPALVQISSSGYEKDNNGCSDLERFLGICNYNDNMGAASYKISIPANATGNANVKDYPFTLNANMYKVTGRISVQKRTL